MNLRGFQAAIKVKNAMAFEAAGKYESALTSIEEALSLQQDYVDAWLVKGVLLAKLGRCNEAYERYEKTIELIHPMLRLGT